MSGRGGRDRPRRDYPQRDYPPRSEERSHHKRSNPPSRHLWIGNLSHSLTESSFTNHLLRFGELESVAFQPGRSYAFVNFKHEEGAFAAMRQLQGFVIAGNALRIEFAKAEKSSPLPRGEEYLHPDERPSVRASPFPQRESRTRYSSVDPPYMDKVDKDKPRMSDKSAEPSAVLWIGFPAQLKVDEFILRKAFSPFGEIDRITAFPGRTYAFVRFKTVSAASRARETLQGKLFGNPRVNICFARSDSGTSNRDRSSMNSPPSPRFRTHEHQGHFENIRQDRSFGNVTGDHDLRSPRFFRDMEPSDPHLGSFGRKENFWAGEDDAFEQRRFSAMGSKLGPSGHAYELQSPARKRHQDFRDFSPQLPRQDPFYDDQWDLPEDPSLFHEAKKLKASSYHPDNELPEYPLSDSRRSKQRVYHDYPQHEILDKTLDTRPVDYGKIPDRPGPSNLPYGDEHDRWNESLEGFQRGSRPLATHPERKRLTPESRPSSVNIEWKWEGTIAKGGTLVCLARCFPVGQPPDMILPEYLDCTARTSLDMLARHYYQAAGSWVVFFAPANDPDIAYYNEFMNYLGEKQRAAVAKLDDSTTLFLVPPSEFSEKVLKVPGKLSMSGVILRLEPSGPSYEQLHEYEKKDTNLQSFQGMASYTNQASPTGRFPSVPSYPNMERAVTRNSQFPVNGAGASPASFSGMSQPNGNGNGHEYRFHQRNVGLGPNRSPHEMQNLNSNTMNIASQASYTAQEYDLAAQESSNAAMALQPEQLAQLTSSLLGQQQMASARGEEFRPPVENAYRPMQNYVPPNNHMPEFPSSQYGQVQQQQQQVTSMPQAALQREVQPGAAAGQDSSDPETRLQATLQLAAALLKQIQQGKGN